MVAEANPNLDERVAELERDNCALRAQVEAFERSASAQRGAARGAGAIGIWLVAGVELNRAFKRWLVAYRSSGTLPVDETADVAGAVVRRLLRVGAFGAMLALLPTVILLHQNWLIAGQNGLIEQQNQYYRDQNAKLQTQIDNQASEVRHARRTELLGVVYGVVDAAPRMRAEAARALVAVERADHKDRIDLSGAKLERAPLGEAQFASVVLQEADLRKADLASANLAGANLSESRLGGANLSWANLEGADLLDIDADSVRFASANMGSTRLRGAQLRGAVLTKATLRGADLGDADLTGAKATGADFREANLKKVRLGGADLREAQLAGANLKGARYDAKTRWPTGFDPAAAGAQQE